MVAAAVTWYGNWAPVGGKERTRPRSLVEDRKSGGRRGEDKQLSTGSLLLSVVLLFSLVFPFPLALSLSPSLPLSLPISIPFSLSLFRLRRRLISKCMYACVHVSSVCACVCARHPFPSARKSHPDGERDVGHSAVRFCYSVPLPLLDSMNNIAVENGTTVSSSSMNSN